MLDKRHEIMPLDTVLLSLALQRIGHEVDRGDKPLAARLPSRVSPCVAAARQNRTDNKEVLLVARMRLIEVQSLSQSLAASLG